MLVYAMSSAPTRRLTAILSADVVGYSALMGADEVGTLDVMRAQRSGVIDPEISQHDGHIVKTTGDGVLVEFPSAVSAVQCAVEVQRELAERDTDLVGDQRVIYRIGINLGDVIHEDGDLFGDGVNVAARIEAMAEPGGVYISGTMHEHVFGKCDLNFVDLGEHALKNIANPVQIFQVNLDPTTVSENPRAILNSSNSSGAGGKRHLPKIIVAASLLAAAVSVAYYRPWMPSAEPEAGEVAVVEEVDKPSIAILPFVNMSGDEEQEYFADGMTEDLITDLSKVSGLIVISRTSTFAYKGISRDIREVAQNLGVRYVIEGSIRKIGGKIRLTAQLIEAETGETLWAERYDRDFSDIFAMQDEVRGKVVSVLAVKLTSDEETRLARSLTNNPEAYDRYLRGTRLEGFFAKDSNVESITLFKQAIDLDPDFAAAYARLAQAYSYAVENNWVEDREKYIKLALDTANKAVELDSDLPYAHWSLARIHTRSFASDIEKSIVHFKKSIELDPNYADGYIFLATTHIFDGHAEKALPLIEKGMRINPQPPFFYHQALGMARFFLGNYEAAVQSFDQALEQSPTASFMQRFLIACYGYLDQPDDAEWAAMEYESLGHTVTIKTLMDSSSLRDPVYRNIFEEGLRKGGLPEG
jgi:adenylate cyclase